MTQPNFLLLTIDTLRTDLLGCYGSTLNLTPNLDALAGDSVLFNQAITGGSWTQAAFPPIMTSTYASKYGGCLGPLSPQRPSPIETLHAGGYQTLGFSTSVLLSSKYGYDRGFSSFIDLIPTEADPFLRRVKGGEKLLRNQTFHTLAGLFGLRFKPARNYVSIHQLNDTILKNGERGLQPFFMWAHIMDTHWPYHIEENLNQPEEIAQSWNDLASMHRVNRKGRVLTPELRQRFLMLYQNALRYTDQAIGELIRKMKDQGLLNNTIIIVLSDHGEEFMERKHWGHFEVNLFDEIIRVPFFIRFPEKGYKKIIQKQVQTMDLMPTILDLADCPSPSGVVGKSLLPMISGGEDAYECNEAISEMWRKERHIVAIRSENYKFIWDNRQPENPQLYNLKSDPSEKVNIADQDSIVVKNFQETLDRHLSTEEGDQVDEPAMVIENDPDVLQRLRDLGYID